MGTDSSFPQTAKEVLTVILAAERSRKYVWTAGRVLMQGGFQGRWGALDSSEKKAVLKNLTELLEALADEGILIVRTDLQGIGYGQEKGFDYSRPK